MVYFGGKKRFLRNSEGAKKSSQNPATPRTSETPFGLEQTEWLSIVAATIEHRYNLLLGAGASAGAICGDGSPAPLGDALRQDICKEFSLPADEVLSLPEAYEEALHSKSPSGRTIHQYLAKRLTNCKPTWHSKLFSSPWRRVWTLNIDDVLDVASRGATTQRTRPIHWTNPFQEIDDPERELQLIYLHGRAADLKRSPIKPVVFSIAEYADATASQHSWHRLFVDLFQAQPFIVVGAKLKDEVDLAKAVRHGNQSFATTRTPSLFISRSISNTDSSRLRRWGLTPVKATAEEFFTTLSEAIQPGLAQRKLRSTNMSHYRAFVDNFAPLERDFVPFQRHRRDFWNGAEPEWNDILKKHLIDLRQYNRLDALLDGLTGSKKPVEALWIRGNAATGKTATLYWSAKLAQERGYETWQFRGTNRLKVDAACSEIRTKQKVALVFDHASDYLGDIAALCKSLDAVDTKQLKVLLILADRSRRIGASAPSTLERDVSFLDTQPINASDAIKFIGRLEKEGRLGKLTGSSMPNRIDFFIKKNAGSIFDSLLDLELGTGFRARISNEIGEIRGLNPKNVIWATSLVHSFGFAIPLPILCRSTGLSAQYVLNLINNDPGVREILLLDNNADEITARTLHRRRAEVITKDLMKASDRYALCTAIAKACSYYVNLRTIQRRTIPYFIIRNLLDRITAETWFPDQARDWYGELEETYEWNSRFWEQRALLESNGGAHDRAVSFARTALVKHHDIYTLNTLATVLLNAATDEISTSESSAIDKYREGIALLVETRETARSRGLVNEHPFITFFYKTIAIARRISHNRAVTVFINQQWKEWMAEALRSVIMKDPDFKAKMNDAKISWERLQLERSLHH